MDMAAKHPPATGGCGRAPVEGTEHGRGGDTPSGNWGGCGRAPVEGTEHGRVGDTSSGNWGLRPCTGGGHRTWTWRRNILRQLGAAAVHRWRAQNMDVAATHPPATGGCCRAPVEGTEHGRSGDTPSGNWGGGCGRAPVEGTEHGRVGDTSSGNWGLRPCTGGGQTDSIVDLGSGFFFFLKWSSC
ncbi:hypothetical protein J6590_067243 [Homalodisca vitripennis]|nr:hypothetical protein J6590_067243 [Homalodisca vitripennis]